jgi:hypothetical protein
VCKIKNEPSGQKGGKVFSAILAIKCQKWAIPLVSKLKNGFCFFEIDNICRISKRLFVLQLKNEKIC